MLQDGFGFAREMLPAPRPSKLVELDRRGLFWMTTDRAGEAPLCASTVKPTEALAIARAKYPRSVVKMVGGAL